MRQVVISDIHGMFDIFLKTLNDVEYNEKNDQLIILGDLIDRGNFSYDVVDYIIQLQKRASVIVLMGNHEDMAINSVENPSNTALWYYNGGRSTVESYEIKGFTINRHIDWIRNLPLFYEDDNFFFCHAGVKPEVPYNRQTRNDLLWIRGEFFDSPVKLPKEVIFGHTPFNAGHAIFKNGAIGIDAGCYHTKRMTSLVIEDNGKNIQKQFSIHGKDFYRNVVENWV